MNSVGVKRVGIVVLQEEAHLPEAEAVTIAEVLAVVAVAGAHDICERGDVNLVHLVSIGGVLALILVRRVIGAGGAVAADETHTDGCTLPLELAGIAHETVCAASRGVPSWRLPEGAPLANVCRLDPRVAHSCQQHQKSSTHNHFRMHA